MYPSRKARALYFVVTCLSITSLCTNTFAQNPVAQVDVILQREMKERAIPGLQMAVVQHGKMILQRNYGFANLIDSETVKASTRFPINSCTKAFTGVAMMQLIEEGKVDLSAPVSRYLDSLPVTWQPVTIRQLLTHVSGLPDVLRLLDSNPNGMDGIGSEAAVWTKIKATPMDFKTGEQFSYNQTNYALLGKIIDKYRAQPFAQVFKTREFDAAGLELTGFGDSREVIAHLAQTYHWVRAFDGIKLSAPMLTTSYADFPAFRRTASGMISTATDLAKWIIALQSGKLFQHPASLQTLWTAGTYNNGQPTQWALGWVTKPRPAHPAVISTGGGRAAFFVYPEDDLSVIVLTNLAGSRPEDFIDEIAGCYNPAIPLSDPISLLRMQLREKGYAQAIPVYQAIQKKQANLKPLEDDLNDWAYRLMSDGRGKDALELFKLNIFIYPQSWNAYDSYGEVLYRMGDRREAIKMYEKSVALNPDNANGKHMLERIQKE